MNSLNAHILVLFSLLPALLAGVSSCATVGSLSDAPPSSTQQKIISVSSYQAHQPLWTIPERFSEFLTDVISEQQRDTYLYFVGHFQSKGGSSSQFCQDMAQLRAEGQLAERVTSISKSIISQMIDSQSQPPAELLRAHSEVLASRPTQPNSNLETIERYQHRVAEQHRPGTNLECFVLTRIAKSAMRHAITARIIALNSLSEDLKAYLSSAHISL